ncbi:MAG: M48 family metalloprotease [Pseudomonadota bacterium]
MRLLKPLVFGLVAMGFVASCTPTNTGPATGSARKAEIGQSEQLVAELRRRKLLNQDARLKRYVDSVGRRIAKQRPKGAPRIRAFVINDPGVNAFTTGGGYVFFNAGLLAVLENEAQFAMVFAHELAHVDRGHVTEGARNRSNVGLGATALAIGAAVAGVPADLAQAVVGVGAQAAVAGFTREQETDADRIGFQYLSGAGYNAAAGAKSFRVLRDLYGDRGGFLATHPQSSERQKLIQGLARRNDAKSGRVGRDDYLRATNNLRRQAIKFYETNDRPREARQAKRNLRRLR